MGKRDGKNLWWAQIKWQICCTYGRHNSCSSGFSFLCREGMLSRSRTHLVLRINFCTTGALFFRGTNWFKIFKPTGSILMGENNKNNNSHYLHSLSFDIISSPNFKKTDLHEIVQVKFWKITGVYLNICNWMVKLYWCQQQIRLDLHANKI